MHMHIHGLDYHVEDEGSGPPILLLHGFTASARNWDDVSERLKQRYRVIRPDLPGHGRTALPESALRCEMAAVADDMAFLLRDLIASPAHVLGYSMGGRLALFMALNYARDVRQLIIESGSPGLATPEERAARRASDEALAERIERDGIEAFVDEWERLPLWHSQVSLPEDVRRRQRELRLANDPHGLALSLRGMGTGAQPSLWDDLLALQPRTLFLAGEHDAKFAALAHQMQVRAPAAVARIIAGAGHTTHLEQCGAFVDAVETFLGKDD